MKAAVAVTFPVRTWQSPCRGPSPSRPVGPPSSALLHVLLLPSTLSGVPFVNTHMWLILLLFLYPSVAFHHSPRPPHVLEFHPSPSQPDPDPVDPTLTQDYTLCINRGLDPWFEHRGQNIYWKSDWKQIRKFRDATSTYSYVAFLSDCLLVVHFTWCYTFLFLRHQAKFASSFLCRSISIFTDIFLPPAEVVGFTFVPCFHSHHDM